MGLVRDHLGETKTDLWTKKRDAVRKKGYYLANELPHRDVKGGVFRKRGCPTGWAR